MASEGELASSQTRSNDPGWKYNILKDKNDKNSVTCIFCSKVTRGGIYRAKQHQIGGHRNAKACSKCPQNVKDELRAYVEIQKSKKNLDGFHDLDFEQGGFGDDEEDEDEVMEIPNVQKKRTGINIGGVDKRKKSNVKGPLDLFMSKGKGKFVQTSINDACDKELRERMVQKLLRFFYQAGIAFNVAKLDSFKEMIGSIGNYGANLKPPSYHELRVPLLKNEVDNVEKWIEGQKVEWSKFGCSIMSDGWTDRRHRTLINFLVNSSKRTVFMESIDASSYAKTGEKLFDLLDKFVERIGEANVVQVITDNRSNFKLAVFIIPFISHGLGKLLMDKRKYLFWTPYGAHCLDLMLEDISKISKVKAAIERGIFVVAYIYKHCGVLNLMREFTKSNELTRSGVTRFATTQKAHLRNMFASEKWVNSKWAKEKKGARCNGIIFTPGFWSNVLFSLKVMGPIVRVLRLVDNEKKPTMGYIYEAMVRAKTTIETALGKDSTDYIMVSTIIDKRWSCQLRHPLHAAGYYFNPEFYCTNPDIENNKEVSDGLIECIRKLVPNKQQKDIILKEMVIWVNQEGSFGLEMAKRGIANIAPDPFQEKKSFETQEVAGSFPKIIIWINMRESGVRWWWWRRLEREGGEELECAILIIHEVIIFDLTDDHRIRGRKMKGAMVQQIHSKKRNRLEHKKLQDLVFVSGRISSQASSSRALVDEESEEDIEDVLEADYQPEGDGNFDGFDSLDE
ncbi:hypothetical protein M8C21_020908 [Ambrosia artemisiifolia]|uniref:DUF659 domain-containing protein n=1 Tax=Ambrosia artemisiifolia TaxID=4212 RepID=A0AAD5BRE9_AMBAR|nr:hypothetical protein M8C21_020908 [Ambrosia artemisiifolia]